MAVKVFRNFVNLNESTPESADFFRNVGKQNYIFLSSPSIFAHRRPQETFTVKYTFKKDDKEQPSAAQTSSIVGRYFQHTHDSLTIFFANQFRENNEERGGLDLLKKLPMLFLEKIYFKKNHIKGIFQSLKSKIYQEDSSTQEIEEKLQELVGALVNEHENTLEIMQKIPVNKESTRMELFQRLYQAKEYMDANFSGKINLKEVADIACLSECHFLRYFKAAFDITPHQYITELRIEKAKKLLHAGNLSMAQISSEIGLENLSSFSRLFKKHIGISPEKYRKQEEKK